MTSFASIVLVSASWAAGPDEAESKPAFELDPITVTAEATPIDLAGATAATVVLTEAEIRARGVSHVGELLRELAGVEVLRQGSPGKATEVRLRGGSAAQTLVLVDGVEVNSPTLGLYDFADLSVDAIERIEVVRGPMSARYGSEAAGGVIQIITKRGQGGLKARASIEGGSLGTVWGRGEASGQSGKAVAWSLAASRLRSDGQELSLGEARSRHDGYDLASVVGRVDLGLGAAARHEISSSFRWSRGDRDLPIDLFASLLDPNASQQDRNFTFTTAWTTTHGRFTPRARLGLATGVQDYDDPRDPGDTSPFGGDFLATTTTERQTVGGDSDVALGRCGVLNLGAEWERAAGRNSDNYSGLNFDRDVVNRAVYVGHRYVAPNHALGRGTSLVVSSALRVDGSSSYETETSPRVGAVLGLHDGLMRLRFDYAHGFRAPSLNELAFPFYGNPDLVPERSRSVEVGAGSRFAGGKADLEVRYVHSRYRDLITSNPVTFRAENLKDSRVRLVEAEGRWLLTPGLYLRGSYTFENAEDEATGDPLLRHPRHRGALSLAYDEPRWRAACDVVLMGQMQDLPAFGHGQVGAWQRVDLAGAYRIGRGHRVEITARVENVLDRGYEELAGFAAPGLAARVGLSVAP